MAQNCQMHCFTEGNTVRQTLGSTAHPNVTPAQPTVVYDTYWRFAAERQRIFFSRLDGKPRPWTDDPVLSKYKFTNVYRAADRTSQYLIKNVIYDGSNDPEEVVFRILLFKIFNKIETWELLRNAVGQPRWSDYDFTKYDRVLNDAFTRGESIYSAAYIMPSPRRFGYTRKHRNHLRLIECMMGDSLPQRLANCVRMQDGFELLRSYSSIGDFLAYQYIIDVNYSEVVAFSENEFVVPGPGALNGIRKCFSDLGGLSEPEIIQLMVEVQEEEFARLGVDFRDLFGRPLKLIDCQNLFCEVDKYARVAHPEIGGRDSRKKIKQSFSPNSTRLNYWFPPKWKINHRIHQGDASKSMT